MKKQLICTECGSTGIGKSFTPGSFWIELVLWLALIVPGLIYSIWRISNEQKVCATCGKNKLIPLESPKGKQIATSFEK